MKKIILATVIAPLLLGLVSCNKFLDVIPEDRLSQEMVLVDEYKINTALNGIYMSMADNTLYGSNLSMSLLDAMAQRYYLPTTQERVAVDFANFIYTTDRAKGQISNMWFGLYNRIMFTNDFLDILNRTELTIPISRESVLRGEAYGLRAFLHFDLLRLWGPSFASMPSITDSCMSYADASEPKIRPMLPAIDIANKVLADLDTAENYLEPYDPIITSGVDTNKTGNIVQDFHLMRNYRINYYAVKALQARVNLYIGNKTKALEIARELIMELESKNTFPWVTRDWVVEGADRIFSSEIVFGIRNREMYINYDQMFAPTLLEQNEFCPLMERQEATFENNLADYRNLPSLWKDAGRDNGGKAFFKYAEPRVTTIGKKGEYLQPLIRLSEIYYIAAECAGELESVERGLEYLEAVRLHRGLAPLVETIGVSGVNDLNREIQKEYEKEFYGEGQSYYYYKRRGITQIQDGKAKGSQMIDLKGARFPLPEDETKNRTGNTDK